ncbi:transposase [Streptomyces sp. NPDC088553]|uniref:transposase n=1 Tax=Streptomyces sp. NPDC088553 TaxID=3365864 RepID=UPI0038086193
MTAFLDGGSWLAVRDCLLSAPTIRLAASGSAKPAAVRVSAGRWKCHLSTEPVLSPRRVRPFTIPLDRRGSHARVRVRGGPDRPGQGARRLSSWGRVLRTVWPASTGTARLRASPGEPPRRRGLARAEDAALQPNPRARCGRHSWASVEPVLSSFRLRPQGGGSAPVDQRAVFTAVVYVLTSGCVWRYLPPTLGVSSATAHRRLSLWTASGYGVACIA